MNPLFRPVFLVVASLLPRGRPSVQNSLLVVRHVPVTVTPVFRYWVTVIPLRRLKVMFLIFIRWRRKILFSALSRGTRLRVTPKSGRMTFSVRRGQTTRRIASSLSPSGANGSGRFRFAFRRVSLTRPRRTNFLVIRTFRRVSRRGLIRSSLPVIKNFLRLMPFMIKLRLRFL